MDEERDRLKNFVKWLSSQDFKLTGYFLLGFIFAYGPFQLYAIIGYLMGKNNAYTGSGLDPLSLKLGFWLWFLLWGYCCKKIVFALGDKLVDWNTKRYDEKRGYL